ncbi:hypothetical protein BD310DRAFT_836540 [Dichomitus squalens]|uniref:Uncharacterized protein n=1 Tax=Dichomitus squalens TaxID=114155 RepID=A0A4Q9QFF1_9APHY|nr:hypothetical protein BD310DRAFT_836540 [Dichomitus squalens]
MFSTMRIFALSGMNYFLAMVTFVLSILPPVLYLIQNLKWNRVENLSVPFNCSGDDFTPRRILIMCTALGRGGSIIADCLVLIITWRRTYWAHKAQRHVGIGPSLNAVMLYNGSIYFVVLASLNAIDLILVILHLSQDSFGSASSYVGLFGDALSPILISRFILSLRQVNQDATQHSNASKSMGLQFSVQTPSGHSLPRSLASLAEPVCMNPEDADMEWEHEAAVDAVTNKEDTVTSVSKADITTAMDGTPDQLNGVAAHEEVIG